MRVHPDCTLKGDLTTASRVCLGVQVFETRVNGAHVHPPSSLSRFIVRDTGNASPRLLRSTLNVVPVSPDMLNNSGMQFALSVQPLALPDPDDDPVVVSGCSGQQIHCTRQAERHDRQSNHSTAMACLQMSCYGAAL
jgi:hypothetical protein